ncbi:hypothetical protein GCM10027396_24380 [Insolitispirillum peregrinum]
MSRFLSLRSIPLLWRASRAMNEKSLSVNGRFQSSRTGMGFLKDYRGSSEAVRESVFQSCVAAVLVRKPASTFRTSL